jgi:hypothetical protein
MMTKKSRLLFVIIAYMAMGVTAGFAHKHHHHDSVKDEVAKPTEQEIQAIKDRNTCFQECDKERDECEIDKKAKNEDYPVQHCAIFRTTCESKC